MGVVGYLYNEIGCDGGSGERVGCFQSRVVGIGPQASYLSPVGDMQGYLNLKAYFEFDAQDRPDGWNIWATFANLACRTNRHQGAAFIQMMAETPPRRSSPAGGVPLVGDEINPFRAKFVRSSQ